LKRLLRMLKRNGLLSRLLKLVIDLNSCFAVYLL
jgi:hypothetical protein